MNIVSVNKSAMEYYKTIDSRINEYCKPFNEYLGISLFIYFKAYYDGSYILLTNDQNISQEYCSNIIEENVQSYI